MAYFKKMIGEKCFLAPYSIEDAQKWAEWFNDLEVTIPLGNEAYTPITYESQQQWISQNPGQHMFNIVDLKTNQPLGRCLLFNINPVDRNAMIGIFIGEKTVWDQGYGSEAMGLLLDYGFNLLNLHSIMLGTYEFNKRAINCYQKLGFKEIGRRRQARIIGNQKFDSILMDLLAEEFESPYVKKLLKSSSGVK